MIRIFFPCYIITHTRYSIVRRNNAIPQKRQEEKKEKRNVTTLAEYRGMKVKLNSPTAIRKGEPGYGRKSKKVFVMKNGKVKKIMFGDPNMPIRKNNPKARASFRARHKCSTAKDKTTARYWSCREW
jgi:hypothetical protein